MDGETLAKFEKIEAEDVRQNHRLDALEEEVKTIHDIAASIRELTLEIKHMSEALNAQSERLDKIENAPIDRLNGARSTAISTAVSAVVGAVIGAIIMLLKNGG